MTPNTNRLYVVVRSDLPPGHQACQATHAALSFAVQWPNLVADWHEASNYLILLSVPDEQALKALTTRVLGRGRRCLLVDEPDFAFGPEPVYTALVIEPGPESSKLVSSLPLALREAAMT